MKRNPSLLRLVVLAMLVAVGVVISPILRVEGMCPTAHLINIVCAVLLGPVYSFVCACTIGVIRMSLMGIPPLALTGAVFGAPCRAFCTASAADGSSSPSSVRWWAPASSARWPPTR